MNGIVVLRAHIGRGGNVEILKVAIGPAAFWNSTLDAVRLWTYKSYLLNGEPTEVDTIITVNSSSSSIGTSKHTVDVAAVAVTGYLAGLAA